MLELHSLLHRFSQITRIKTIRYSNGLLLASLRNQSGNSIPNSDNTGVTEGNFSSMGTGLTVGDKPNIAGGALPVTFTPGSGPLLHENSENKLLAPTTVLTERCDTISEAFSKMEELKLQKKAQETLGEGADIFSSEHIDSMVEEFQEAATNAMVQLVDDARKPGMMQRAGMHELRRTLYYTTSLKEKELVDPQSYTAMMRMLTVEMLRRDNEGVLAPDDVLYVTTFAVAADFYNRHLWNRMEHQLMKITQYDTIDMATIKAMTTKLFKTRRGCSKETLDMRRKILSAMSRRVGVLANDYDLPSLLGILQCYSIHDMTPFTLEPLAIRATNHVQDYTPQESATLSHVLRKWRLMRLDVCERIIERICTADQLNFHMVNAALISIRTCYNQVSDGGRNAINAEPTRQKLRALGEQISCRIEEAEFPALPVVLVVLDIIVNLKIYVPKKSLQHIFSQANTMVSVMIDQKDDWMDPKTGKQIRPITAEEGRQLQALLMHYGTDLCPELLTKIRHALQEGLLPDEASL